MMMTRIVTVKKMTMTEMKKMMIMVLMMMMTTTKLMIIRVVMVCLTGFFNFFRHKDCQLSSNSA